MSERSIPKLARRRDGAPRRKRLRFALRGDRLLGLVLDRALGGAIRVLSDQNPARRRCRLEARAGVDHVARDDAFPEVGARVERDERLTGVHADPDLERERRVGLVHLRDRLLDRERRAHRPLGVVLVGNRRSEDGDDRVADELLDGAAVPLELLPETCVVRSEHRADVLGVEPLRPLGRPDHVREDDRDDLALLATSRGCGGERRPALGAELRSIGIVEAA